MKTFFFKAITLFFLGLLSSAVFAGATPGDTSLAPLLQRILPAIVNVKAKIKITDFAALQEIQRQQNQQNAKQGNNNNQQVPDNFTSIGSGVIVDGNKGYILTNAHVVNDAQSVAVTLSDGRHFTAKIIGADKGSDVALLQINAKGLTAIPMANSNDLKVGDFVAAIGSPFGLNQTVTSGIVSALGRSMLGIESYENFIQTDAPINPGNSGGALINMQGQLIGINTAILAPTRGSIGIGFAIPVNMAKSVMMQLIQYGNVKRGLLGIGAQDVTPELANAFGSGTVKGAAVTMVLPNSPAQQAGIQVGDIITSVNNVEAKNASDVVNAVGFLRVDSSTNIDLLRQGKKISVNVTLSDAKKRNENIEKQDPFFYGVGLKNFTLLSPIHGNVAGVLVLAVEDGSNAWNSDLRPGDIITSINQQKIKSIDELKAITAKSDKTLLMNVLRGPSAMFLVINREP